MRLEWLFNARSAASSRACATSDSSRLLTDVTGTFIDRARIDWSALLARVRAPADRALIESLCALETIRRDTSPGVPDESRFLSYRLARVVAIAAAVQISIGALCVLHATIAGSTIGQRGVQIATAVAFAAGGTMLASTASRDARRMFLLCTFLCVASTYTRGTLVGITDPWSAVAASLFRAVPLEVFVPFTLWCFAADFPRVHRYTRFDLLARRIAVIAWIAAIAALAANAAAAVDQRWIERLGWLLPESPQHTFWNAFSLFVVPAVIAIFVRSQRAPYLERQRVWRFALALSIGLVPFLAAGLVRAFVPGLEQWFRTSPHRLWVDVAIVTGLMATPLLGTAAIVVDRPFDLRFWCWRSRRFRRSLSAARLARAVDDISRARGTRETTVALARAVRAGVGASSVSVATMDRDGECTGNLTPLPVETALLALLQDSSGPVDLSRQGLLFELLPSADRDWTIANGIELVTPVRRRDGTIAALVALGPRTGGSSYDRQDHVLLTTVCTAASVAWDTDRRSVSVGEPAYECPQCGIVADTPPLPCTCGAGERLAVLPRQLGSKFRVERRLGSGGAGVVYLARDLTIDRAVALKTLPRVSDKRVAQLHHEARAMAALNHDALATIYGLEIWRDIPVLVVEYFPDGTLEHRLGGGPIPVLAAIDLGLSVARGLSYMHERQMLHRDLKPSNIALTPTGKAKLLDFGLAMLADDDDARGTIAGTAAYLPPEAFRGEPAAPTFDLWAIATVLREATAGCRDGAVDAFFARALARDVTDRFQTSVEFEAALTALAALVRSLRADQTPSDRSPNRPRSKS
jgi:Protein kinase domain